MTHSARSHRKPFSEQNQAGNKLFAAISFLRGILSFLQLSVFNYTNSPGSGIFYNPSNLACTYISHIPLQGRGGQLRPPQQRPLPAGRHGGAEPWRETGEAEGPSAAQPWPSLPRPPPQHRCGRPCRDPRLGTAGALLGELLPEPAGKPSAVVASVSSEGAALLFASGRQNEEPLGVPTPFFL